MRFRYLLALASSFAVLTILGAAAGTDEAMVSHKDGAPVAHTGGFGEQTCLSCHFDGTLNDPSGWLLLAGVPQIYVPDSAYTITISVGRPSLGRAGFLLSVRFGDGSPAGALVPLDSQVKLVSGNTQVPFATHTAPGNRVESDSASWRLVWRAPPRGLNSASFNLAANAANGDDSEFGDQIYAIEQITRGESKSTRVE